MKKITYNEYQKAVNLAIDYINAHINETVDLKSLSEIANISAFHFHRIFKAIIGESVASYISRLRLENVAQRLQSSNQTLAEIAEKTGYQSQFSLSKAFKKHFGIAPSAFRNSHSYCSLQSQTPVKYFSEELSPEIRIIEKKELVYIRIIAGYGSKNEYETAWEKLCKYAKQKGIANERNEFIGLSFDSPDVTKPEQCRFYACITTEQALKPEGEFGRIFIEGGKYAVFTLTGSYAGLTGLYQTIYGHWLPSGEEKLRNSMPFEKYLNNPGAVEESKLLTEIFIPVK
ncbi:MAG: AraC family transcriptional regulator [Prevotellaceae bacterium]|jgi:AraC family transcriptional regulator|nr:AraC family transcriptional regulator [Prevotellaceae bacterium]